MTALAATPFNVDDLIAAGNKILHDTPDNLWWNMRPQEVVEFAFPDWEIAEARENANYNKPNYSTPRVLLKHRTIADQWFFIWTGGLELLPGRMSTMGQFFRFKPARQDFAVGTPDDLVARVRRRRHPDSQRDLLWWLLDVFAAQYPTPHPAYTYDARTEAPLWALLTAADATLQWVRNEGTPLNTTKDVLAHGLPDWEVLGVTDRGPTRTIQSDSRALLCHRTDADRWILATSYEEAVLGTDADGLMQFRAGEDKHASTRYAQHTLDSLLAEERKDKETWADTTRLWWTLHQIASNHPDPTIAAACRNEMVTAFDALTDNDNVDYRLLTKYLSDNPQG